MRLPERIIIIGFLFSLRYKSSRAETILQNDELFPLEGCDFVKNGCMYNAYCNFIFNADYDKTLISNDDSNYCNNVMQYFGRNFLPINILFKNGYSKPFRQIEEYNTYDDGVLSYASPYSFVESVDFSYNSYSDIPDIGYLINLKTLNISHNMLMIAILSNAENFDYLQEIDFSFNNIETIDVRTEERPFKELKVLNLSHNSLTVIPEATLYHFIKLEQLDISHNLITHIDNKVFFGLKQLLILNLSYNHIKSLSQSLDKLYILKELYLQENELSAIQYNNIHSLKSLVKVDLSSNNIQNVEKSVFNNMTHLSFLNLRNNHLKTLEKDMLANSNELEFIDLSQNEITKLPIYIFKQKIISHFCIAENKIEGNLIKGMFEGLKNVEKLDLSYQKIKSINNAAFLGVENMNELLLNNNQISNLEKHSFRSLTKLISLDLSNNLISNFTLDTEDIQSLEFLYLCNNEITHIERTQLQFLSNLEFLDISDNKIISIEPNSFSIHPFVKVLLISNNRLHGSLLPDTFNGLQEVPELDLSNSLLTHISDRSFDGMTHLTTVNISHCFISNISYNAFINTGNLNTLDMSYNQLTYLSINTTEMTKLKTLILHNNLIQTLHENLFDKIVQLQTLDLSYNSLLYLGDNVFGALGKLEFLNVSNNINLTVRFEIVKHLENLKALKLSGTKANIIFEQQQSSLLVLEMSNAGIRNLSNLKLRNIINLSHLVLSHNNISSLREDIVNMSSLHSVDLSYNKIKLLQPDSFTGCANLNLLNISHNLITNINYGAFHGLFRLNLLDMSYNLLENLEDEKFYRMHFLEQLIVDYNKISYVTIEQFLGTSLKILSIGGNPLPCKSLIKLKHDDDRYSFQITALFNKSSEHNYYGVSCVDNYHKDNIDYKIKDSNFQTEGDIKVLMDIRNILKDLTINTVKHDDWIALSNNIITNIQNYSTREELNNLITILRSFSNLTMKNEETNNKINGEIKQELEKSNSFIERILKIIVAKNYDATQLPFENASNSTKYLKDLKDLENNFILEKERIVSEFDDKILALSKKIQIKTDNSNNKSPTFTEVCVALMLLILVCFVAFYIYRTQLTSFADRISTSTRQITVDMDNSNL